MSPHSAHRAGVHRAPVGRRSCLVALIAVAALALAACGGGPSAKKSGDGTVHITVIRAVTSTFEPLIIAQQQGYYAAEGLSVTFTTGATDSSQNAPSVIRGDVQFSLTDGGGFIKATANQLPIQVVTGLQSATTKSPTSDGLLVNGNSPLKSITDLAGKTVALPLLGGTLQFLCEYSAKQAGMDPSTIKFVALPVASLLDAVKTGKVDAAFTFATYYNAGIAAGMRSLVKGGNELLPGLMQSLMFTSTSYATQHPDVVKKFVTAVGKGIVYANAHSDAVRAVDRNYTKLPADYIAKRLISIFSPLIDTKVLKLQIDDMQEFGMIKSAPDVSTIVWNQAPTTTSTQ